MKPIRIASLAVVALVAAAALSLDAQTPPAAPDPAKPPAPARVRTSPHETVTTVLGDRRAGVRLTIVYGRPYTKDPRTGEARQVWGGLVPWDKAWRLGADEATLLLTPVPLTFDGTTIPAGAHTLYLVPSETGTTKLAFSSAIAKWGVPVDETKDVARIPMTLHTLEAPLDQLTLGIEADPSGAGGLLKIAWGTTQFAAAFTVAK